MRNPARLLPIAILLVSALLMITSARRMSATVDETHYVGVGRYLLERGDWGLKGALLHPPLSYYLNSILLLRAPASEAVWEASHQDDRGRAFLKILPGHRALFLSRLPAILLTIGMFLLLFIGGKRAFGFRGGTAALALAAFEPNILAHGALATPDLPLTATVLWATLRTRRYCDEGGGANLFLAGLAVGLALLSKFSALLLLGILPAAALAARPDRRFILRAPGVLLVALIVLNAAYIPLQVHGRTADFPYRSGVLPGPYAEGIEIQRRANEGHRAFFLGEISSEGWRAYYPVAMAVKTPIPFLLLALAGIGFAVRDRRRREIAWFLLPAAAIILFFVFVSRINIGLRYLLPAYPFLALLGGYAVSLARRRPAAVIVTALLVWHGAGALAAWPNHLSYFNEAAGGSEGGARILSDSNLDWGQDLPGLKRFLDENGYEGCYLSYFGNGDPERYGIRFRYLPGWTYTLPSEWMKRSLAFHPDPELVAISRFNLQGVRLPNPDLYDWLDNYPRVAAIGGSILVYDIGGDRAAHERIARAYKMAGRLEHFRDELLVGAGWGGKR